MSRVTGRRPWLALRVGVSGCALLAALGMAVATHGDAQKKLDAWARQVCAPTRPAITAAQRALADTGVVNPKESPSALRDRLAKDLGVLASSNTTIATAITSAGVPQVDGGAQTTKAAAAELRAVASGYGALKKQVAALSTKDQKKFGSGLANLGPKVGALDKQSTAALKKLQTGKLGRTLAGQVACKRVSSAGGTPSASASPSSGAASPSATSSKKPGKTPAAKSPSAKATKSSGKPSSSSSAKSSTSAHPGSS